MECLDVFTEKYTAKDSYTLTAFLSKDYSALEYLKVTECCDPDSVKVLENLFQQKCRSSNRRQQH